MTDLCAEGDVLPEKIAGNNSTGTKGVGFQLLCLFLPYPKPFHPPQQHQNGSPTVGPPGPQTNPIRPPLTRIDSRSNFPGLRPGFPPGTGVRPQQIRPGSQPFPQRIQVPLNRPPGQPPFPQNTPQNTQGYPPQPFPQGQGYPQGQPRANFRPLTPFPRPPQVPGQRPPGIFQQRSVPSFGQQRPHFAEEAQELQRSQTLDSGELLASKTDNDKQPEQTVEETASKPGLAAMKSRSYSLQSNTSEHHDTLEERRRSVSSVESFGEKENGEKDEPSSRPESRMSRMNKIMEDEDDRLSVTSNRSPSSLTDVSQKSVDNSHNDTFSKSPTSYNKSEVIISASNGDEKPQASKQDSRPVSRAEASKEAVNVNSPNKSEGDNDSGVDESTQGNEPSSNGETRTSARKSSNKSRTSSATPTKARSLSRGSKSPASLLSPDSNATTPCTEKKKVPMNKIQVGAAPSPNLKVVKSKIGSLENASYKPGGGKIKIETKKLDFKKAAPRIEAKNDRYTPKGGDKKIQSAKLQWSAKSKIGSLENSTYKPKGGDKKIESVKLDFKEKAKSKVGSTANLKHTPGGGDIKIENRKIELNVSSKIGSLDNMKHKPGGGDKKIFDDKDYLKQKANSTSLNQSLSGSQNSIPSQPDVAVPKSDENLNQQH